MQIHEDKQVQYLASNGLQRPPRDTCFNPRNGMVSDKRLTLGAKGNGWSLNYIGVLLTRKSCSEIKVSQNTAKQALRKR